MSLERVPTLLAELAPHAPKRVLRLLAGRDDDASFALREQLMETGREVIESLAALDHPRAWDMRRASLAAHPSTVARSLMRLPHSPAREALLADCAEAGAGDVHTLRRLRAVEEWAGRPDWVSARAWLADEEDA